MGLGVLASCAEEAPQDDLAVSVPADRFGLLTISYSEHRVPGGAEPQLLMGGFFARHAGLTRDGVLSVLNLPDTPGGADLDQPVGSCRYAERELGGTMDDDGGAFVDLLDAGSVRLTIDGRKVGLRRRSFPDIFGSVSGITYEGALDDPTGTSGAVLVEGRGSYEVGSFMVSVTPPPVARLLEVDGAPVLGTYASLRWDADAEVRWLPQERVVASEPLPVVVEVVALQFNRVASVRCVVDDTGSMLVPRSELQKLAPSATADATVRLVLRRIARARFAAAGLHSGEVMFISRDSVLLQ